MDGNLLNYNLGGSMKKGLNLQNFRTFQFLAQFLFFSKYGQDAPIFKQFLVATQLIKFYLKTTQYFRTYRNPQQPSNILLQKNQIPALKKEQQSSTNQKSKIESIKEILQNIKKGPWTKKDYQPEMFQQYPNGKNIQLVSSRPIPSDLAHKRLTIWEMIGELLLMIRPVAAIIAIRIYGQDSYIPYFLSLIIELVAFWLQRKATLLNSIEAMEWKSRQSDFIWRVLFKRPVFKVITEKVVKKILGLFMAEHRWIYRLIMYVIQINSSITLTI